MEWDSKTNMSPIFALWMLKLFRFSAIAQTGVAMKKLPQAVVISTDITALLKSIDDLIVP